MTRHRGRRGIEIRKNGYGWGGWGYIYGFLGCRALGGLCVPVVGLLVGVDWLVLASGVTGAMGCCQWACRVGWYQVIGCEGVVGAFAFSAYPAVGCCVPNYLCSALVCACVVGS